MLAQTDLSAIPVMPVHLLFGPETAQFNALHRGAFDSLAFSFWVSGCSDLPSDQATLAVLAGCHNRRWNECSQIVLKAFNLAAPKLKAAYLHSLRVKAAYRANAQKATKASIIRFAAKRASQTLSAETKPYSSELSDTIPSQAVPLQPIRREIEKQAPSRDGLIPRKVQRGLAAGLSDAPTAKK